LPYILGGEKAGQTLFSLNNKSLRPIPSKVKAAVFSIIENLIDLREVEVLDLFAGTGSFGLEALSRGAKFAVFIEINKKIFEVLVKNIQKLGYSTKTRAWNKDAFRFIRSTSSSFDLIYVAPPQFRDLCFLCARDIFTKPDLLKKDGLLVFQLDKKEDFNLTPTHFKLITDRIYGDTRVLFYSKV
jgi:16S rRNA (guanine966-N2)-methyltransferase